MEEEKKTSYFGLIKNLFQTSFNLVGDTISLANAEAKLAGISVKYLILLSIVQIALLTSSWCGLCAILVCTLVYFKLSWLIALCIVTGVNLLIVIGVLIAMLKLKENLTFKATRRHLLRDDRKK